MRVCNNLRMDADNRCGRHVDSDYVELAVEVFSMLADATRVRIVLALSEGELPVNDLAEQVGKSPAAVSQHLAKLRLARVVATRNEGTRVFYRLTNEHARQLVSDAIFQAEHQLGGTPAHHHEGAAGPRHRPEPRHRHDAQDGRPLARQRPRGVLTQRPLAP